LNSKTNKRYPKTIIGLEAIIGLETIIGPETIISGNDYCRKLKFC